jgi:pyruvate/2-oxoglutarate dehydrogenase complex dihydrolipoamide acyltransferase (E2) component
VDINFIMGSGDKIAFPVIRAVESKGLGVISRQLIDYEQQLFAADNDVATSFLTNSDVNALGTFTIYNLGECFSGSLFLQYCVFVIVLFAVTHSLYSLYSLDLLSYHAILTTARNNSTLLCCLFVCLFVVAPTGMFGVKSAAPIVLTPQACALAIGAIVDTVIPSTTTASSTAETTSTPKWEVAPMLTATITSDHRVVDGALAAQWLSAFKAYLEKPETLLL